MVLAGTEVVHWKITLNENISEDEASNSAFTSEQEEGQHENLLCACPNQAAWKQSIQFR